MYNYYINHELNYNFLNCNIYTKGINMWAFYKKRNKIVYKIKITKFQFINDL